MVSGDVNAEGQLHRVKAWCVPATSYTRDQVSGAKPLAARVTGLSAASCCRQHGLHLAPFPEITE